jgi:hypothetical protein
MPSCLEDMGPAAAAVAAGRVRTTFVRRHPHHPDPRTTRMNSRDAFLFSLVEADTTLRTLVDVSGMSENEGIAIVDRLVRMPMLIVE